MPQLDTPTWLITALSSTIALFVSFQLKISSQNFPNTPVIKSFKLLKTKNPWESKWMKIYLPLSSPPQ